MAPPAPADPHKAETVSREVVLIISRTRSSIALILRHDSSAGLLAASITFKCMPFDQNSVPPSRTRTLMGRDLIYKYASFKRSHCLVCIAIVKIKMQVANAIRFLIPNLSERPDFALAQEIFG